MDPTRRSLRDRLDEALHALGALASEDEMRARAREICDAYPEHLVLNALVSHLDGAHSRLRGGLGLLAQHLPRDKAEKALLRTVLNKRLSSTARLSAVTILQDYLERPVQSQFVADIADTDAVVLTSMKEAFAARDRYPGVLIEYTQQFAQLDPSHRTYVLGLLPRVPVTDAVELLRFMAYHRTASVVSAALHELEAMTGEEAEQTLYILSQTLYLDPEHRQTARTLLRRKRIRGESHFTPPPLSAGAHAMPLGFTQAGGLLVQFVIPQAAFPLLLEYDRKVGIRRMQPVAMASHAPATGMWGKYIGKQGPGHIVAAADPDGTRLAFFRWHLSFTLAQVGGAVPHQPYPEDFQIWAPLLWQWQPPDVASDILALFESGAGQTHTSPDALAREFDRHSLVGEMPGNTQAWLLRQASRTDRESRATGKSVRMADTDDPMYRYFIWWLQTASAIHLQAQDSIRSQTLSQAAALLATYPEGAATFFGEIHSLLGAEHDSRES